MAKKETNADQLIAKVIEGIEEVKGQDIDILDLRELDNMVCDYFIICNGTSNTQVSDGVTQVFGPYNPSSSRTLGQHPPAMYALSNAPLRGLG